jgi:drug/metabolite transporter (DMT)-like permease
VKRRMLGFAVLCLLAGTSPVLDGFLPEAPAGLAGLGLRLGLLAVLFGLAGSRGRGSWGTRRVAFRIVCWGGLLLAGLPVAFAGGAGHVSGPTEFLVLALIPVAVVFFESQRTAGFGTERGIFALLAPALVGFAGAGLLITYDIPGSAPGMAWLALMVVLAGAAGVAIVRLHGLVQGVAAVRVAALLCLGGAVVCFAFCWIGWTPLVRPAGAAMAITAARLLLLDGPAMLLTAWLLGVLAPVRFSARYLLALLVAVIESFALAQPGLSWTIGLGVLLLAGGGAVLWRGEQRVV